MSSSASPPGSGVMKLPSASPLGSAVTTLPPESPSESLATMVSSASPPGSAVTMLPSASQPGSVLQTSCAHVFDIRKTDGDGSSSAQNSITTPASCAPMENESNALQESCSHQFTFFRADTRHYTCDKCKVAVQQGAELYGCRQRNIDFCSRCIGQVLKECGGTIAQMTFLMPSAAKGEQTCSHMLSLWNTDRPGFTCDSCGLSHYQDAPLYGCRVCDFDLCPPCYDRKNQQGSTTSPPGSYQQQSCQSVSAAVRDQNHAEVPRITDVKSVVPTPGSACSTSLATPQILTMRQDVPQHEDAGFVKSSRKSSVTFAPCPQDPARIRDYLYLGSISAARDRSALEELGITHVLNVADDVECFYTDTFEYFHCQIADGGFDDAILESFQKATDFVEKARQAGGKVLVHCFMGINRSATVTMAILMNLEGWTLREAHDHTKSQRPCIAPFLGNRQKIANWEWRTLGVCTIPEWSETHCS